MMSPADTAISFLRLRWSSGAANGSAASENAAVAVKTRSRSFCKVGSRNLSAAGFWDSAASATCFLLLVLVAECFGFLNSLFELYCEITCVI